MKHPFTLFSKLLPLALAWGTGLGAWGQVTYSTVPLTASSFTSDVIANGAAASPATSSTTADVDGAGYYFISQDFYTASIAHTSGIPNNGAIPNTLAGPAALTYQLASLSANNSLRLAGATSGTVTFATPTAASEVYVLGSSGSGISTVDVTVTYADNTTTTFTSQTYPDWFTGSSTLNVFGTTGRASVATPVSTPYTATNTAPFLDQLKLTIPATSITKNITSLAFAKTSTAGVLNILAVSVGIIPVCAAAPTNLTAAASTTAAGGTALAAACASTSIYLSVSGVPASAGYTYQWQSSTSSATAGFSNISGATSSTYTATGQTVTTYYRVLVACPYAGTGSPAVASTAAQVTQNAPTSCYCTPTYASGGVNDNITRVRLGTLDNSTTGNASPYYRDYSAQQTGSAATLSIPTLAQGGTASVTLNFASDPTQYSAVWIDFNQNGSFETTEYFSLNTSAGGNGQAVIPITIPAVATLGQTRMRARGGDDNPITSAQACGASSSGYGEAEDYLVNIVGAAPACTPTTATFSYPATSYCVSGTTNPTVVLASGATAGTFSSTTGLTLNATTGAITLSSSTPGSYTVTNTVAATATNCASTATATVTITAAPTAGFSYATPAPAPAAACAGGTGTFAPALTTGATAGTFSSTTGLAINATTGVISLAGSTAGTYTITNTVAASGGCAAATSTATFTVNALPPTPTLTTTGTPATGITLTSSATTGNQFYLNGTPIAGATNQTYLINSGNQNGSYTVRVTNAAGCTATSAAVAVTVTATAQAQAATSLTVAPNPTPDGLVTLELSGFHEAVSLLVLNTLGQRVAESTIASSALGQKQTLNLSALPAGVYLLQARTASGALQVRRIVRE